jgi:SAM-dependent methyltransferase
MSDGPVKMAPPDGQDAPALDDIILGDDDQTMPLPSAPARSAASGAGAPSTTRDIDALTKAIEAGAPSTGASVPPVVPEDRPSRRNSTRVKAADDPSKDTRKRQKMTLRIPDDEVSRPQLPATTPMGGVPAVSASRPPSRPDYAEDTAAMPAVQPSRIISIGSPDDTLELPKAELEARGRAADLEARGVGRAPGIDGSHEAGWTPYQPAVADGAPAMPLGKHRDPARTMIDEPGMGAMASVIAEQRAAEARAKEEADGDRVSAPPVSEDIPIDTDDDDAPAPHDRRDRSDEVVTNPRLSQLDSEEIKLDEGERRTDPGEAADEIGADDLVSVESIPRPHSPHSPHAAPPLIKGAPVPAAGGPAAKHAVTPTPSAVTATSLMAGVSPLGAGLSTPHISAPLAGGIGRDGVTPIAPAVAARAQSTPPPAMAATPIAASLATPAPTPGDSASYTAPAAGTPMARRQQPAGGPFGFEGGAAGGAGAPGAVGAGVGALAPPAMNEAAAHRKKIRPWWEDLFNDDFIRTMAKITDADIAREANFIEESLGCEAGATILDLACGTGRHAVELASRGYQVVGFDLSLAMLARASDEAQDRKQKINFVQGDMREMTFEETFDGVFSWNTSFGYFDEEKNAAVIAKVHRALKKGGQFLLDVVNRDNLVRQAPSLAWFEGDGCICMDEMQVDFITSRMKVKRTLMMDDGRTKEIEYSVRVYSLHELGKMLHDNGFRVAEVSGRTGTPGVFFGCESPRTLILAEKR